jgi:predicted dehydrogenase
MCEKPLAISIPECQQMLLAAANTGRVLMVGHDMRFEPANVLAHKLLASGELGKIITIRSSVKHAGPDNWSIDKGRHTWFFKKEAAVFGAMGDVGIHKMDLIRFFTDDDFDRVCAMTGTLQKKDNHDQPITVEDNAACLFVTKGGIQGVMEASWCNYGSVDMSSDILCEKGRLKILMDNTYKVIVEKQDGSRANMEIPAAKDSGVTRHFIDTILDGAENPDLGLSGARTVASVVACFESAEHGKWINVQNDF